MVALVSMIMVTGKSPDRLPLAISACKSIALQTWPLTELIIVNDGDTSVLSVLPRESLELMGGRIYERMLPSRSLTLGGLRNIGLEMSNGLFVSQADDDDWAHKDRISLQMSHAHPRHAVLLKSQIRYSFVRNTAMVWRWNYTSVPGIPGTVLHAKLPMARYRSEGKAEDDHFLQDHFSRNIEVIENDPIIYLRFFHGASNTWDEKHIMGRKAGVENTWFLPSHAADYLHQVLTTHYPWHVFQKPTVCHSAT